MRLTLCGVRGSRPAPGQPFCRYGGNTSCVTVSRGEGAPHLILDAGTGITRVSSLLRGDPFVGTILFGHLHWDHTQGLPFFAAGDSPDAEVEIVIPEQGDTEAVMDRFMSPPHFPIRARELRGRRSFGSLEPGVHEIEGFEVEAIEIPHKGGRMFGYRISDGVATVAYMSDHAPIELGPGPEGFGEYHPAAMALAAGVDLLVHDAQYTVEEFPARAHFGHTTPDYAVELGRRAGAKEVLLFHHEPSRSDEAMDALAARFSQVEGGPAVRVAVEEAVIELPGSSDSGH